MACYAIRLTTTHPIPKGCQGKVWWLTEDDPMQIDASEGALPMKFNDLSKAQEVARNVALNFWRYVTEVVDLDQPGFFLHVYGLAREPGQDNEDRAEAELYIGPCTWMQYTYGDLRIGFDTDDGSHGEVHGVPVIDDELVVGGRSWSDWTFATGAPADAPTIPASAEVFDASMFFVDPPERKMAQYRVTRHEKWGCSITVEASADDPTEAIEFASSPEGQQRFDEANSEFVGVIEDGYDVEQIE